MLRIHRAVAVVQKAIQQFCIEILKKKKIVRTVYLFVSSAAEQRSFEEKQNKLKKEENKKRKENQKKGKKKRRKSSFCRKS